MRPITLLITGAAMTACGLFAQQQPAAAPALNPQLKVHVGDEAPDFTLPDNNNKPVKLSDFRGKKNVVLAFFVAAFTGG
jgi:cytochrome oxidase Cu insertion factor (SCO1/SenC/PrrC family)